MDKKKSKNVLVSMCLLGVNCRYDGKNNLTDELIDVLNEYGYNIIPICPEQLGGLCTPRKPSEIVKQSKVINCDGEDVSNNFISGANEALKIAKLYNCEFCVLKSKSPSCGFKAVYDGSFSGKLVEESGLTAKLLDENGYDIFNEKEIKKIVEYIKK